MNDSNTQLTRTNVDLDNFIYTASHDLKAPITNIEGLLLALEHELPAADRPGDVSLMLTMMQDAIDRFRRTIAHLTDLSRLQKEHNPDADAVALAPVVEAVRLDLTPLFAHTHGRLTVIIPEGLTVTFAEKTCARWSTTCSATPSSTTTPTGCPRCSCAAFSPPTTPCWRCRTTAWGWICRRARSGSLPCSAPAPARQGHSGPLYGQAHSGKCRRPH